MRFRRALDRANVTEAPSAASELPFIGLAEALEIERAKIQLTSSSTSLTPAPASPAGAI
jgi:hypothetical protein